MVGSVQRAAAVCRLEARVRWHGWRALRAKSAANRHRAQLESAMQEALRLTE